MGDAPHLWNECSEVLQNQVSRAIWLSTFQQAQPVSLDAQRLVLSVPSPTVKDRIERTYLPLVVDAVRDKGGEHLDLAISVDRATPETRSAPDPLADGHDQSAPPVAGGPIDLSPDVAAAGPEVVQQPRYTFEAFVTGPSNRFAHAAALRVAEQPGQSYNPLFLYGEAGLGKTHLLYSIQHYVIENYPRYVVRYVSSEKFLHEFVESIRQGSNDQFKRRYREVDVLLVDDIQFIQHRKETQEEFFHTFNALHEQGKQIVLSSDRPPDEIPTLEARLRSRFKMGLPVDIQPPDLETRLAILRKKSERLPVAVPDEVLELIGENVTDNIRELEGALNRVAAYGNLTDQWIDVDLAKKVLSDVLAEGRPHKITVEDILAAASERFNLSVDQIIGPSRQRPLVHARQVAMYVARELTEDSFPLLGAAFGGRDHTTVMHAVNKVNGRMAEKHATYDDVSTLIKQLKQQA